MPFTRIARYAGFMLFSTGWIVVLFLSAACFYAEYEGAIHGTSTSFPLPQFGIQLGVLGALWCATVMATHAVLPIRALRNCAQQPEVN
jgi:hypothetical protein